jgi:DNA invertase Pin-like site-specific DNA recombinase
MGFFVRGYGRASTAAQCLSTAQQNSICYEYFLAQKQIRPGWADAEWGGWFADEAVSRDSEFMQREMGSRIVALSKPGDVIIAAKLDRAFVNTADVHNTLAYLPSKQIDVVLLDINIDTTTAIGQCLVKVFAAIKELEVNEIRARTKAAASYRRQIGRPNSKAPFGYEIVKVKLPGVEKLQNYLVPDHAVRRLCDKVFEISESHGHAGGRVTANILNVMGVKNFQGRTWKPHAVIRYLHAARHGYPLPNGQLEPAPIPPDGEIVKVKVVLVKPDA